MLAVELVNQHIPQLQLEDSIAKAKQLINDYKLTHLPVVTDNVFIGLISEEDLLDVEDDKITIQAIQECFLQQSIFDDIHFLNAINYCNQFESNIVPVINRNNSFIGCIPSIELMKTIGLFSGANEIGGIIVLEIEQVHFSISEISRIVESNNATIFHLNTITNPLNGIMLITLHINNREISSIVASFERYEYHVKYHFGHHQFEETTEYNFKNLMNYLNI